MQYFNICSFGLLAARLIFTYMGRNIYFLLAVVMLAPLFCFSQECIIQRETDPYTKEIKLSTGFIQLKNATLSIQADKKEIDFFFIISGEDKCFTDAASASVFFEGSKVKISIRNTGSMNCDGFFHFVFKNQALVPSSLQRLASQKVTRILFTGNEKKETQITLTADQQFLWMHSASCLLEEARKLLPG